MVKICNCSRLYVQRQTSYLDIHLVNYCTLNTTWMETLLYIYQNSLTKIILFRVSQMRLREGDSGSKLMVNGYGSARPHCETGMSPPHLRNEMMVFRPILCTLLRLNWSNQTPGIMRQN